MWKSISWTHNEDRPKQHPSNDEVMGDQNEAMSQAGEDKDGKLADRTTERNVEF